MASVDDITGVAVLGASIGIATGTFALTKKLLEPAKNKAKKVKSIWY